MNPSPGGREIYKLGRPFLGHHTLILSLCKSCPEGRFFKKTHQFHILVKIDQVVPEKMLTDDARRRTP